MLRQGVLLTKAVSTPNIAAFDYELVVSDLARGYRSGDGRDGLIAVSSFQGIAKVVGGRVGVVIHHFILIIGFSNFDRHRSWHQLGSMPTTAADPGDSGSEIMLNLCLCAGNNGLLGSLSFDPIADGRYDHGPRSQRQAFLVFRLDGGFRNNVGTFLIRDHVQFGIDINLDILFQISKRPTQWAVERRVVDVQKGADALVVECMRARGDKQGLVYRNSKQTYWWQKFRARIDGSAGETYKYSNPS